jgi:ketosteroid isomerase-like protein
VLSAPPLRHFLNNAGRCAALCAPWHIFKVSRKEDHKMNKAIAWALFVAVSALLAVGQTMSPQTDENRLVEQEVRRLNAEETQAFLHRDAKALATLWSDDLVVTNPLNKFVTKQQVLGMIDSGLLVITSYDRSIEYIRAYGDMAIVAGSETVVWGGKMPNAGKIEHLRFTGVWMKQGGGWKEIARHANIVPHQ